MKLNGHNDDATGAVDFQTASPGPPAFIVGLLIASVGFAAGLVIDALILTLIAAITVVFKIHPDWFWVIVLLSVIPATTTFGPLVLCVIGYPKS